MNEHWKPVVGYEGSYEVSDQGHVRSLDRFNSRGHRIRGGVLKPAPDHSGHLHLRLSRDARSQGAYVHALVLAAFIGTRPIGQEACHNDGNPQNNRLDNLRWDSRSENARDRVRHGTHPESRKTACPRGHALVEPNLMPSATRRGHRSCLACNRAHASASPFSKQLADAHYERIIAEVSL